MLNQNQKLQTSIIIATIQTNALTTDDDDKTKVHIRVKILTCMFKMQCYTYTIDCIIVITSLHRRTQIIPICEYMFCGECSTIDFSMYIVFI